VASSWILFFSYQDDAQSNTHQNHQSNTIILKWILNKLGLRM